MDWLTKYWWILVLVFLVGVMINVIKDLTRVDHKNFSPISRICRRIVILTTSGTMTTTGRRTTRRRSKICPLPGNALARLRLTRLAR
jgi:hypothetical protein